MAAKTTPVRTQRAYTLRLRSANPRDQSWRDALWATHAAVNKGARVFGDWLLTLRGGLDHTLADAKLKGGTHKPDRDPTPEERRNRRILLALSWLSVESAPGTDDAHGQFVVAYGTDSKASRDEKVLKCFRGLLAKRGLSESDIACWVDDCAPSLSAAIREDAVWVNRSDAFDAAQRRVGESLTRDEVWDMLGPFFGSRDSYLTPITSEEDEDGVRAPAEEKSKDLVQKAGQWLSSRFGTGRGADFKGMVPVYESISAWAQAQTEFASGADALSALSIFLAPFRPPSRDANGILRLISGPGYKSKTRNIISAWSASTAVISTEGLRKLAKAATADAQKCKDDADRKGPRPYAKPILEDVERACGFTYLQPKAAARHSEYAVMLDHAARRVSVAHSWIKRAETERQRFSADAEMLRNVPEVAQKWLDEYCRARTGASSALEPYRIRKRAVEGWKEVVSRWSRADCKTEEDRIAAAREIADPEIDKRGDIQLFEALAADDAMCLWQFNGKADAQPVLDYVAATDALAKQRRFKVPAYRHPDALLHPVFCDFGQSRWYICFAVHQALKAKPAKTTRKTAVNASDWLTNHRALQMRLWDGTSLRRDLRLCWSSKRLMKDLSLRSIATQQTSKGEVTRADRLGRAAANANKNDPVAILGVFDQEHWNGRLQAPRPQLSAIAARVSKHGWDQKARRMRDSLRWFVTFSANLQTYGPWMELAAHSNSIQHDPASWPHVDSNKQRKGHARLILSRLPGLRVLSVDLGHRFAAACAVWEALSTNTMKQEVGTGTIRAGGMSKVDLYCHVEKPTDMVANNGRNKGKPVTKTTIYRRIGADTLPDGAPHPAPWARLDRQFIIKLPGEDTRARAASTSGDASEMEMVQNLAKSLGLVVNDDHNKGRAVDHLMSWAVRILTLALKRHARHAKIAYALDPQTVSIPGMGDSEKAFTPGDDDHITFLANALLDWHALASDSQWNDKIARELWNEHIASLDDQWLIHDTTTDPLADEGLTRQQRRKKDDERREQLKSLAERLAKADRTAMHRAWKQRWERDDGTPADQGIARSATGFHAHLRLITDWIMGRRLPGAVGNGWRQNVGGLALTRIATMRSLYQLHKAFAMRAKPDKPRGASEKGETNAGVARSILNAMEKMREQRVKQLASRITEAALGIGRIKFEHIEAGAERPRTRVDKPCHAVVIENLTNYRPDERQTRRENRQLMAWSSSKVKKFLSEACTLHGLHLREVEAGYTSRQDSRTGAPGMRCQDVPVKEFMTAPWWRRQVNRANEKVRAGTGDARDRYLHKLDQILRRVASQDGSKSVRIPLDGGELFVSADPRSPSVNGVQADLNAAANIGLRALLDPDWPGKWWYVPCAAATHQPHPDKVKGSDVFKACELLAPLPDSISSQNGPKPAKKQREIVNLWRDPSAEGPQTGQKWRGTAEYWNDVRCRVIGVCEAWSDKNIPLESPAAPW